MVEERTSLGLAGSRNDSPRGASLQVLLILAFIVEALIAAGWVGYLSVREGRREVDEVARQLREETASTIERHVESFLDTPQRIDEMNAGLIGAGLVPIDAPELLERTFWEQIQAFDSVSSIYFGNLAGGIVDAGREGAGGRQYVIATYGFEAGTFRKFAAGPAGERGELLQIVPDFDARTRPWYIDAVSIGGPAWSDIYVLFSGQDMAIASSCPVYEPDGGLLGVVSCDIFLSQISQLLGDVKIAETGIGFIVDRDGLLVASTTEERPLAATGGAVERLLGVDSSVPAIQAASAYLSDRFAWSSVPTSFQSEFVLDGAHQLLQVSEIADSQGIDWLLVLVVPESDFLAGITSMGRMTMLWIGVATLVAMLFGLLIARGVTRPVRRLEKAAEALAEGTWEAVPHVGWIREIHSLARSFNTMSGKLQRSWHELRGEVAERQETEKELRESEARYRLLADNVSDVIWTMDLDGILTYVSPSVERLRGYTPEEIIGRPLSVVLTPASYEAAMRRFEGLRRQVLSGEYDGLAERFELEQPCKDGSTVWTEVAITPLLDDRGKILGIIGMSRDITVRRRTAAEKAAVEAQLRQSQKLESIGTLASGIAHEINNPLTGIINYADLIERRIDDAQLKEYAEGIIGEGNRVAEIVRSLLAFARQETPARVPTQVREILDRVMMLTGVAFRRDQIKVAIDVDETLPPILCRAQQIQQVILNLLTNARDALNRRYTGYDENKRIVVTVRRWTRDGSDDWVRITIEDHGTGIPEDLQGRIFDPFFTTKSRDEGTGLGLSVSYGIIREHKGELSVESGPGVYTRFHVDLPIYGDDES